MVYRGAICGGVGAVEYIVFGVYEAGVLAPVVHFSCPVGVGGISGVSCKTGCKL